MGYSTMLMGKGFKQPRNSVKQIINYLKENNFKTESEIQENLFGYYRNETFESNKKYADLLRRALYKGLICRAPFKRNKSKFVYFVIPNEFQNSINNLFGPSIY